MDPRSLPDLAVFLEVVRSGSITRAARRLNTVQSNVTARIKKLERAASAPLLRRHARGVRPTPAGEAALGLALRLDAIADDFAFTFGAGPAGRSGKLRVGAIETVLASHLPRVMSGFAREFPRVDLRPTAGSSASLLKSLQEGELDAAFVSRAPAGGLRHRPAFRDELVVAAPRREGFGPGLWRTPGEPVNILVQRLGCSYTERLLGHLARESKRAYRLLELGSLDAILAFVEAGLGVAAMPRAFVASAGARRKVAVLGLPKSVGLLETHLVAPPAAECTFAANAFFERALA